MTGLADFNRPLVSDTNDIFGPASATESKQLSKVIKSEGAAQKKSLSTSYDQLSKLQKLQKQACTDESRALKAHGKASEYTHKMHSRFLDAKAAWEKAEATEKSKADMLAASQERAAEFQPRAKPIHFLGRPLRFLEE